MASAPTTASALLSTVHPDMYGLGIRTAFYIQWLGLIAAPWMTISSSPFRPASAFSPPATLRFLNTCSAAALFLALLLRTTTSSPAGVLRAAETYVILLLAFGAFYFLIPFYLWRFVKSSCSSRRAESSSRGEERGRTRSWGLGPLGKAFEFLLLVGMLCFQMWFWTTGVGLARARVGDQEGEAADEDEYGFLFSKVVIDAAGFVAWNIVWALAMLLGCLWILCLRAGLVRSPRRRRRKRKNGRQSSIRTTASLQLMAVFETSIATALVCATELTIQWNGLGGADGLSSAAQLIPLAVSAGFVTKALYHWLLSQGDPSRHHRRAHRPGGGSSPRSSRTSKSSGGGNGGSNGGARSSGRRGSGIGSRRGSVPDAVPVPIPPPIAVYGSGPVPGAAPGNAPGPLPGDAQEGGFPVSDPDSESSGEEGSTSEGDGEGGEYVDPGDLGLGGDGGGGAGAYPVMGNADLHMGMPGGFGGGGFGAPPPPPPSYPPVIPPGPGFPTFHNFQDGPPPPPPPGSMTMPAHLGGGGPPPPPPPPA